MKMKKYFKVLLISLMLLFNFGMMLSPLAAAEYGNYGLDSTVNGTGLPAPAPGTGGTYRSYLLNLVGGYVGLVLSFVGVIFFLLVVYAGILWMTAAGDPKKVDTAKSILSTAIIGLILIYSAYAIVSFVGDNI